MLEYLNFGITEFREEATDFHGNEDILIGQGNYVIVYGEDKVLKDVSEYLECQRARHSDKVRAGNSH